MTSTQRIEDVVIKFAGDSGDGMQLTGSQFTNNTALIGADLSTFPDFPAEIRAPQGTLPGVSGYQLCRTLRRDPPWASLPIIMVTSKDQETDRIWGMRQGAVDYLVKPVSMEKLIEKAQAALAG